MSEPHAHQEAQYGRPYHWFLDPATYPGRIYFGYWKLAIDLLEKEKLTGKLLDAGCGDGRFLQELKTRGARHLFGIDVSERAISFARLLLSEVELRVARVEELPFEAAFFDVVFLIETLEHIPPGEIPAVLGELRRVLQPDGQLILSVPSPNQPLQKKHHQHFSLESLRNALQPFFEIEEAIGQDVAGSHPVKLLGKFSDNRFWQIKPLARWYNRVIWPKVLNRTTPEKGRRLIVRARPKRSGG